jgi:2-polyprenyl-3-methyl-5-hydroxy-6-metoxy-1,4-benzoquinol methylase
MEPAQSATAHASQFVRTLANGDRNQRFGVQLEPASRLAPAIARVWPYFRHAIEQELRYPPIAWPGACLLDVGCGDGVFMRRAAFAANTSRCWPANPDRRPAG